VKPPLGALLALLACALPAAAQGTGLAGRVDEATLQEVRPALDAAARDSLPVAALESKVLEGVAKRRPAAEIGRVVVELAQDFRAARAAIREGLPGRPIVDGEVVATALATRQGIPPDVVRELLTSRSDAGSMEIPVTVLTELVRRGVPVDEASAAMSQVVRAAVPMQVAAQIPGRVDGALGRGAPPGQALAAALRNLNIPQPPGRGRGRT
jgi:hypothetical protein